MTTPNPPGRRGPQSFSGAAKGGHAGADLNPAQIEFARLLGLLLAKRWIQNQAAVPERLAGKVPEDRKSEVAE